jgi:hypothetical protein
MARRPGQALPAKDDQKERRWMMMILWGAALSGCLELSTDTRELAATQPATVRLGNICQNGRWSHSTTSPADLGPPAGLTVSSCHIARREYLFCNDMHGRSMWLFGVAGFVACTGPPVTHLPQPATSSCPSWGCGGNSPVMGPFEFHELEEHGAPNEANMRLIGFRKNGVLYNPHVEKDKLYALDQVTRAPVLSGSDLLGGTFEVLLPGTGPAETRTAEIRISHVSTDVTFWLGPSDPVETYELEFTGIVLPPGAFRPLCLHPPLVDDGEGQTNVRPFETILYTGDRYNAHTKEVTASTYKAAGYWFNFACAGSALAKLHLNRHTTASATAGFTTTADQRQAMLKMYTGDFCGTGEAFTQQGTRIHWTNALGWSSPPGSTTTYESLWTSRGAVCLTTHRLHGLSPIDYEGMIQGTSTSRGRCPRRPCAEIIGFPSLAATGTYILTQSPALP